MYTLDTNAIIYYLTANSSTTILDDIIDNEAQLYVSTISELELFGFSHLTSRESKSIEIFLQGVTIIPLDSRVARVAAQIRREYKIKTPDSVIAATAIMTGTTLVTRNVRDFHNIAILPLQRV